MNKLIITQKDQIICTALAEGQKILQLSLEPVRRKAALNSIYIGRVQNIKKNINSAFIDIGEGITGYYSLSDNPRHLHADGTRTTDLKQGDEILVQVARDAVKTKALVLTGRLSFTGRLAVLTAGKNGIGFSSKISDQAFKKRIRERLSQEDMEGFGLIIRTNAKDADEETLMEEIYSLKGEYERIIQKAPFRNCCSLLYQGPASFLTGVRDSYSSQLEEIITDEPNLYEQITAYLEKEQPEDKRKLRLYQDSLLSLKSLYNLDRALEDAVSRKVWLKSGGYLVVEPTEALVVIDVNTGKYSEKKTLRETILKINLEAAEEIGRQLRLRNLSGIILIDFIDMAEEADRKALLSYLEEVVKKDPIKTTVVEMTKLNLVELTRKKIHKPLHEQLAALRGREEEAKENWV